MSVDISRLSAGLPPEQQQAVARVYRLRAKNPTTAFLLCFFLGIFGAHCFYLGKTGQGVLRLVISPLIIPGIIWEIVDLFRIDGEVYERNLKLAEQLVAEAMLAAPPVGAEQEAIRRLDQVLQDQERTQAAGSAATAAAPVVAEALAAPAAQMAAPTDDAAAASGPAGATGDAAAHDESTGATSAPEAPVWPVDAALAASAVTALAEEQSAGHEQQPARTQEPAPASFEYAEPSPAPQWPTPETGQGASAAPAGATAAAPAPGGRGESEGADAAASAAGTASWSAGQTPEAGDTVAGEPAHPWPEARPLTPEPSESSPLWAKPPALMAEGGLAAAAAGAAAAEHIDDTSPEGPAAPADAAAARSASFGSAWPEVGSAGTTWQTPSDDDALTAQVEPNAFAGEPGPDDTWATITPEAVAAAALLANQVAPVRRAPAFDVTDQTAETGDPGYVADIGEGGPAGRVHVTIPLSQPLEDPYAFDAPPAQRPASPEYLAAPFAAAETQAGALPSEPAPYADEAAAGTPSASLLLVPLAEAAATVSTDPVAGQAAAGAAEWPQTDVPSTDAAPTSSQGAMPAAGDYESHVTEEVHDQGGQAGRRVVKRVRVVRRLTVNGQVQEVSAEQVVDADADTSAAAASLLQTLGTTDLETVARMAGALPEHYVIHKVDQSGGSSAPGSSDQSAQPEQPEQQGQSGSGEAGQGDA